MLESDIANDVVARLLSSSNPILDLFDTSGLEKQPGRSWRPQFERKGPVWSNSNSSRDWHSCSHMCSSGIKLLDRCSAPCGMLSSRITHLAEVHALDSFATKRRTYWRTGTGLPRSHYEFDNLIFGWHFTRHGGLRKATLKQRAACGVKRY